MGASPSFQTHQKMDLFLLPQTTGIARKSIRENEDNIFKLWFIILTLFIYLQIIL